MQRRFIIMNVDKDNVATALVDLEKGEIVKINETLSIVVNKKIDMGHKFALSPINKGENVIKYGEVIGTAKRDIAQGDWVHNNIRSPYVGGGADKDGE